MYSESLISSSELYEPSEDVTDNSSSSFNSLT